MSLLCKWGSYQKELTSLLEGFCSIFSMLQGLWLVNAVVCDLSHSELTFQSQLVLHWLVIGEPLCETVQLTLKVSLQTPYESKHEKWAWFDITWHDMQYYYHARHPTDDWHLAYMFSLVYFSVEVCLEGVFPHYTWQDSCVRVYAPLTLAPPSRKNQNRTGGPSSPLEPSEGAFELTHGSACIIGW